MAKPWNGSRVRNVDARVAELRVDATLDDAEERLPGVAGVCRLEAPDRPAVRALHRLARRLEVRPRIVHHVEHHHDVRAQRLLHRDAALGRQQLAAVVVEAPEVGTALGDLPVLGEAEDLVPARVGQHASVPAHEAVDAAQPLEDLAARAQHQVVGVTEEDACPGLAGLVDADVAEGGMGRHRHEDGRRDVAAAGVQHARPGEAIHPLEGESQGAQCSSGTLPQARR